MLNYEKLGSFYLGRGYDLERKKTTDEPLLYDSKDLTTHAVCVGMTGSGKTGLCVSLLEEAAIDGIPALIIGLIIFGFFKGGAEHSLQSITIWILVNGVLPALGAALALGHPLTILSAFLAAPLTSLNPMIAAGWVSGLVQAVVKKPTVEDLENLPEAITTVKGFWLNPVVRILLVVALSNLGSTLGTLIGGSWIAGRSLS